MGLLVRSVALAAQRRFVCDYIITGKPLTLAAGRFGLGHGSGAHALDEYYTIESTNPKIQGFDGAVMSFVECLYELAK